MHGRVLLKPCKERNAIISRLIWQYSILQNIVEISNLALNELDSSTGSNLDLWSSMWVKYLLPRSLFKASSSLSTSNCRLKYRHILDRWTKIN